MRKIAEQHNDWYLPVQDGLAMALTITMTITSKLQGSANDRYLPVQDGLATRIWKKESSGLCPLSAS